MVVDLQFVIVVVWVCVLGGCHGIHWRGFGFIGVGVGLLAWVVVVWVCQRGYGGFGWLPWDSVAWVWVSRRGCGFASMGYGGFGWLP